MIGKFRAQNFRPECAREVRRVAMGKQPIYRAVTLGELADQGQWVWAYCLDCSHDRFIRPEQIPLPRDFPVPRLEDRLKCSACASRNVHVKPATCWPHIDPETDLLAPLVQGGGRAAAAVRRARRPAPPLGASPHPCR